MTLKGAPRGGTACNKVHIKEVTFESTKCLLKQTKEISSVAANSVPVLCKKWALQSPRVFVGGHVFGGADSHVLWRWETDKKVGQKKEKKNLKDHSISARNL